MASRLTPDRRFASVDVAQMIHTMAGEEVIGSCPACGSGLRGRARAVKGMTLYECGACSLVYSDPQPRAAISDRYLVEYDLAEHFGPLAPRKRVLYDRRLERLGSPSPDAARLIDLGCGDGQFLGLARERGWDVYGVELNPPAARRAADTGATIFEGALEELDELPWGTFDLVTAWDSIEHTPTPAAFLETAVRLIRPGARIALTTLNINALVARVFRRRWSMYVDDHFTYWSREPLVNMLTSSDLVIEDVFHNGIGRDFVGWVDRLRPLISAVRQDSAVPSATEGPAQGGWDSNANTVALEDRLNRALDSLALGVEVGVIATKPRGDGPAGVKLG